MKHIKYADKTLLVGDDAADTIVEYATALAQSDAADNVNLDGYGPDGQDTTASFVLNAGRALRFTGRCRSRRCAARPARRTGAVNDPHTERSNQRRRFH